MNSASSRIMPDEPNILPYPAGDAPAGGVPGGATGGAPGRPPRSWRGKFADALRGIKHGIRGHSSFFAHFFIAAWVLAAAAVFQCSLLEWCLLLGCIGLVLTAELFNSAIETLFHGLDARTRQRGFRALDIAAGAVLMASLTAATIGTLIFVPKLLQLSGWR
jgi:diacylglycerol kinase